MIIFYSIPLLPVLLLIISLLYASTSWIRDALPVLVCILLIKNIYIDIFYSIFKKKHNPFVSIFHFLLGFVRIAVFYPLLNLFLHNSGGLSGLLNIIMSLIFVIPIFSILWLMGECYSLIYGTGDESGISGAGVTIFCNVLSIAITLLICLFFYLA